jgi:predicted transcriptional regulator
MSTTGIELTDDVETRVQRLAAARSQSAGLLIQEAVEQYIEREEKRQDFHQAGITAWERLQTAGLHVTDEEADAWLEKLEDGRSAAGQTGG